MSLSFRILFRQVIEVLRSPDGRRATAIVMVPAAALVLAAPVHGQFLRAVNPLDRAGDGLQLYSVSAFGSYYSTAVPIYGGYTTVSPLIQSFGSDVGLGGSVSVGWTKRRRSSTFGVNYTATYTGNLRYTEWNRLNHSFSFNTGRPVKLKRRLTLDVSGNAGVNSIDQYLFTPNAVGAVAASANAYDDLVATAMRGGFSTSQIAAALTGSPLQDGPVRGLVFGSRVLSAGLQAGLSYSVTPRLAVRFGVNGTRFQPLRGAAGSNSSDSTAPRDWMLNGVTGAAVDLSLSYSLNRRTQVGAGIAENRTFSGIQDTYNTSVNTFLGRKVTLNWFVQLNAGAGLITPVRHIYALPTRPQPSFGIATGYRKGGHTLLASHQRGSADAFAVGASWTLCTSAGWAWASRSGWGLQSSFSHQLMRNRSIGDIVGWQATSGIGRSLGRGFNTDVQYSHMVFSGLYNAAFHQFGVDGVRASIVWTPGAQTARPARRRAR